jgi:hypothetical protein
MPTGFARLLTHGCLHCECQAQTSESPEADKQVRPDEPQPGAIAIPKTPRQRDREHLRFVTRQPCLVCGRQPCDPRHLRFAQPKGLTQKVSDEFTVPLCRAHHRELHRTGKEIDWWSRIGINPLNCARQLWLATHPFTCNHEIILRSTV